MFDRNVAIMIMANHSTFKLNKEALSVKTLRLVYYSVMHPRNGVVRVGNLGRDQLPMGGYHATRTHTARPLGSEC